MAASPVDLHPDHQILKGFKEDLAGSSHICNPDGFKTTLLSQGNVLRQPLGARKAGRKHNQGREFGLLGSSS